MRAHDGKVVTLHSNTRWCSDSFRIQCFNGEHVDVAFSLDCCDREVLSWVSSTRGIDGGLVRDLMIQTLEYRFGRIPKLIRAIQRWSDNGPAYTAHETVTFGKHLGFDVVTTPSYSPQSNGMAEAFVKTFHPHKGLGMLSPRQYLQQTAIN